MVAMDESYGSRARIGYTSPPLLTEVFTYDFYRLAPPGATLVLTTPAIPARNKDRVDRSYEISMQSALAIAPAGVRLPGPGRRPGSGSRSPAAQRPRERRGRCGAQRKPCSRGLTRRRAPWT